MPEEIPLQRTIGTPVEAEGMALHTGVRTRVRLLPAELNCGIVFRRVDLPGAPEIPARVDQVVSVDRGTILGRDGALVRTVEHLLAAAVAGVDNLVVELDSPEPPALDGSAAPFAKLLESAGICSQDAPVKVWAATKPLAITEGEACYSVVPDDRYVVSAAIEFPHPLIRRQFASYVVEPETFGSEIAPARTFGFLKDAEALRSRGLAQGASPQNTVVLTEDGILEGAPLRFPDEFVRHKILDIMGDLALVGRRIRAHIVAERPGHRGNIALARALAEEARRAENDRILDIQQIMQVLPHRYPFLLVDRIVEFEPGKRIVGIKNVTINEPFFQGHFPGHPIMPGVLIIEAMAQVGGMLLMGCVDDPEHKVVYFMSLDNVKFRRRVTPGDQIRFELEMVQLRGRTCRMKGVGRVEGQVVAEAEMMARLVDR
ncbi:MAG: bifunctional UDP-3-O-[3-hydroxymyristoyl] N-acetylglucosamine deacetylase/3-hydroxyacyl-ACP dehydratase [Gemmatimonadetes bacterium]|nr:bifunctional UDP-3-O-[3-hydroxymyristoyl] N-acetylglucosamine deacetylase/3-hydroxyacyl-ACP dehydratase [Gemmatimonadota bacterium]